MIFLSYFSSAVIKPIRSRQSKSRMHWSFCIFSKTYNSNWRKYQLISILLRFLMQEMNQFWSLRRYFCLEKKFMTEHFIWCPQILISLLLLTLFFSGLCPSYLSTYTLTFWLLPSICLCSYTDSYTQSPPLSCTYALQLHLVSSESHLLYSSASTQSACGIRFGWSVIFVQFCYFKKRVVLFLLFIHKEGWLLIQHFDAFF